MVLRTPALNSLKKGLGIFPQIHHPLPLDRRGSQLLLNQLTSSFRKNLDQEHPWQAQEAAVVPDEPEPSALVSKDTTQNHHVTDRHLDSILSNPLFANPRNESRPPVQNTPQNPLDVFDRAVSKGMMTPRRAAGFLVAVRKQILNSSTLDVQKAMADSGAGVRVVRWLRASGIENNLSFLSEPALVLHLVSFLFAAGLDEIVWTWLSRLGSRLCDTQVDVETETFVRRLLFNTILHHRIVNPNSGIDEGMNLDSAYSSLLRATQTLPMEHSAVSAHLQKNWTSLSWTSTVDAWKHPKPSAPLFEMFVDIGRPWDKPLDIAHLELHHPVTPDHASAIKYLHGKGRIAKAVEEAKKGNSKKYPRRMFSLGSDTVRRLEEVGHTREAVWVKEFISRTFFAWNRDLHDSWTALR